MKKRNSKLLCDMFLLEDNFTEGYDHQAEYFSKIYCNDNFEIRKNLFYNTLFAHKINPKKGYDQNRFVEQKLVKRFFPRIMSLLIILLVSAVIFFLFFVYKSDVSHSIDIKKFCVEFVYFSRYIFGIYIPIYLILFLKDIKMNRKYIQIKRRYKKSIISNENENDDKFVEDMINNNLKFYRKMKLEKLKKV